MMWMCLKLKDPYKLSKLNDDDNDQIDLGVHHSCTNHDIPGNPVAVTDDFWGNSRRLNIQNRGHNFFHTWEIRPKPWCPAVNQNNTTNDRHVMCRTPRRSSSFKGWVSPTMRHAVKQYKPHHLWGGLSLGESHDEKPTDFGVPHFQTKPFAMNLFPSEQRSKVMCRSQGLEPPIDKQIAGFFNGLVEESASGRK
jgi:hypothetical protein